MATVITQAGPWNMTVFAFDEGEPDNPLGRLSAADVGVLPFGAVELSSDGKVVAYNDTEPEGAGGMGQAIIGRDFFGDVGRWAGNSLVAKEFHKGVAGGALNVVFDCAVAGLSYKVRIHLKVSPILGTFWVFIKRLQRAPAAA
jgi:photoactive yellow protein